MKNISEWTGENIVWMWGLSLIAIGLIQLLFNDFESVIVFEVFEETWLSLFTTCLLIISIVLNWKWLNTREAGKGRHRGKMALVALIIILSLVWLIPILFILYFIANVSGLQ